MSEGSNFLQFQTIADFLRHIMEVCDDIDHVEIPLSEEVVITVEGAKSCSTDEIYMVLHLMNGEQFLVLKREAEALLDSGLFGRMRIPIKLIKHKDQ